MLSKSLRSLDPSLYETVRAARPRRACITARRARAALIGCVVAILMMADSSAAAQQSARPGFDVINRAVEDHFNSLPDYQAGDLVTQSQVEAALVSVRDAGWDVPESDRLVKLALPDSSFLASQFATREGRKFARKIARHPGAYGRLDRLSSIARGQKIVRDLIAQPGGDKFIEYLATASGGQNLGRMLAGARHGSDLNKPTGRIYTAADLLAELQRVYAATK